MEIFAALTAGSRKQMKAKKVFMQAAIAHEGFGDEEISVSRRGRLIIYLWREEARYGVSVRRFVGLLPHGVNLFLQERTTFIP